MRYIIILSLITTLFSCSTTKKGFSFLGRGDNLTDKEIAEQVYVEASKEKMLENYEEALSLFRKALKLPGEKSAIYYEIGQIYLVQKKYSEAKKYTKKAIQINNNNKWYYLQLVELGRKTGDFINIESSYLSLIKLDPNNIDYTFDLTKIYIKLRAYKKAINLFENVENKIGISENISKRKYLLYHQIKEYANAIQELNSLIKLQPLKMEYYQYLGDVYLDMDKENEAKKTWEKALQKAPNDAFIYFDMASFYLGKEEIDSSIYFLKKVMVDVSFPASEKTKTLKKLFRYDSREEKHQDDLKNLLQLASNTHPYSFKLSELNGNFLFDKGSYASAQLEFKKAVEIKPNSYSTWRSIILCDFNLNQFKLMIDHTDEALELFPTQSEIYYYNGLAQYKNKKFPEAIYSLEEGLGLTVRNKQLKIQFLSLLGEVCNSSENYSKSDEYFDQALQLDSSDYYIMNNYAYYLSLRRDKLKKAKELSLKSNELFPDNASFQDTYGWILYEMMDYENSIIWLTKAVENSEPKSSIILLHLGDAFKKNKQIKKAKETWELGLEIDPNSKILQKRLKP